MDDTELDRKQVKLIVGVRTADRLDGMINDRQLQLKERLEKLQLIQKFSPFGKQIGQIEFLMKTIAELNEKQIGAIKKSRGVVDHKVKAILERDTSRDETENAAFERALDSAIASLQRYNEAATLHLETLDRLIEEADKILASR